MRPSIIPLVLLAAFSAGGRLHAVEAAESALPAIVGVDGPEDSLYQVARQALNRSEYRRAAETFAALAKRYPRSIYVADAMYWEAFARYRLGGDEQLRRAVDLLEIQRSRFPKAVTRGDAEALATRIRGELARRGDPQAAESVSIVASGATASASSSATVSTSVTTVSSAERDGCDDDSDIKIAALNGLLQMDAERAMPILAKVLARRDPGSVCLRRKAVFLVAQKRTADTENQLLAAARNDPDPEVRGQAVFWLSQVHSDRAVAALDSIARRSTEAELQEKAVFALSQQRDPRATQALKEIAENRQMNRDIREKAIFWLGQRHGEGAEYLKGLYDRLDDDELREKVIFGIGQSRSPESRKWLFDLAQNEKADIELRKKAIFWAGQGGASATDFGTLYAGLKSAELKEQVIFALSQVKDPAALDRLVEIARKDGDPEMRKKALFWLSQRHDPRVADILEQILNE
jgi:HEAT repeat protein